jgi:hypothetical protein
MSQSDDESVSQPCRTISKLPLPSGATNRAQRWTKCASDVVTGAEAAT